jgi:hypothetical protein
MPTPVVFPVERRAVGIAKEVTAGTPVLPTATIPVEKFAPDDKITGLIDKSWRQSMAEEYAYIQGTYNTDLDLGGPVYADTIGYSLLNLFGDYTSTGTATTPNSTLSAPAVAGATSITVVSGTGFLANQWIQVGPDATGGAEIVQVLSVATNTITLTSSTPLRFGHANASAVTNTSAGAGNYTHVFSLLNSGTNGAQPPTHTLTDITGIPATNLARVYSSCCFSDIVLTGNATALLTWDGKASGWLSAIAASIPTVSVSTQPTQAAWNSIVGVGGPATGGTLNSYVEEWVLNIQRKLGIYWTAQGVQNPYIIARGGLAASLTLKFGPAPSEAQLLNFLNNTQPQVQIIATGPNSSSIQIDAQLTAFDTAKIADGKEAFGYDVSAKLIGNTTNVGFSAGFSPCKITLKNAVPSY